MCKVPGILALGSRRRPWFMLERFWSMTETLLNPLMPCAHAGSIQRRCVVSHGDSMRTCVAQGGLILVALPDHRIMNNLTWSEQNSLQALRERVVRLKKCRLNLISNDRLLRAEYSAAAFPKRNWASTLLMNVSPCPSQPSRAYASTCMSTRDILEAHADLPIVRYLGTCLTATHQLEHCNPKSPVQQPRTRDVLHSSCHLYLGSC